jgi:hypothetical protein
MPVAIVVLALASYKRADVMAGFMERNLKIGPAALTESAALTAI